MLQKYYQRENTQKMAKQLSNIFKEGELAKNSVCRNYRRTAADMFTDWHDT